MKRSFGPVFIVVAAILWGVDGILRRNLYTLSPISIVFYEHLFGLALIAPFAIKKIKTEVFSKREKASIVWISFFSGLMGTLWFTIALQKTNFIPFSVVFLLQKIQPVFTTLTAAILLKESITRKYMLWAAAAMVSAYFVTFKGGIVSLQTDSANIVAAGFAVLAAFAWGTSTAFSKYSLKNHSHTSITGLRFFLTTIFAYIGIRMSQGSFIPEIISLTQSSQLVFIAISTGMFALWLYYKGLKTTKAKISTIVELAFPLTGVLIDGVVYQTTLHWSQYVAAAALIFSIKKISHLNQEYEI